MPEQYENWGTEWGAVVGEAGDRGFCMASPLPCARPVPRHAGFQRCPRSALWLGRSAACRELLDPRQRCGSRIPELVPLELSAERRPPPPPGHQQSLRCWTQQQSHVASEATWEAPCTSSIPRWGQGGRQGELPLGRTRSKFWRVNRRFPGRRGCEHIPG